MACLTVHWLVLAGCHSQPTFPFFFDSAFSQASCRFKKLQAFSYESKNWVGSPTKNQQSFPISLENARQNADMPRDGPSSLLSKLLRSRRKPWPGVFGMLCPGWLFA